MTTVLIVEDDPINLRIFTKILVKRGGFLVKGTDNVEEIFKLTEEGSIDIVLMDISLGNSTYQGKSFDGIKITQMIKANPKTSSLPIILVTAHAMEGNREIFLKQSGADSYMSKPIVNHEEFVNHIKSLIN